MCARRESQEGDFYGVRGGVYGNGGEKQSSPPAHRDINNISLSSVIGRLPRMAAHVVVKSNFTVSRSGKNKDGCDRVERDLRINRGRRNLFEDERRKVHTLRCLNRLHRSTSSFYEYSSHILGRDDEAIFFTPASRATTRTCANAKRCGVAISSDIYIYIRLDKLRPAIKV